MLHSDYSNKLNTVGNIIPWYCSKEVTITALLSTKQQQNDKAGSRQKDPGSRNQALEEGHWDTA